MLLSDGTFHADPHPGNLLLMFGGQIGLIDFGQCKTLSLEAKIKLARITVALADGDKGRISMALAETGIVFGGNPSELDPTTAAKLAFVLFDTRDLPEANVSPLSQDSILQNNPLTKFNQSLWLVS